MVVDVDLETNADASYVMLDINEKVDSDSVSLGHDDAVIDNGAAEAEKVDDVIHIRDDAITDSGTADAEAEERVETEKEVKKPSFKDILIVNPNGPFENKRPKVIKVRQNCVNPAAVSVRVAEKKVSKDDCGKDAIRQKIDLKEAAWKQEKEVYESAVRNKMALRVLLEEKNAKIGETQSALKRFMAGTARKGSKLSLPDGMENIYNALASSGIGIHDLDKEELADELLKPLNKEIDLLNESIRKAEEFTEALKEKYDKQTEELDTLRAQLGEADDVYREASENLMRLLNNNFTEQKEDLMRAKEDKDSCNTEQIEESSVPTSCTDQTSKKEEGCSSEGATENEEGSNKEIAEMGDSDLTKVSGKEVESSEIKVKTAGEETTNINDHNNHKTQRTSNNTRNQKRRARRARAKMKKSDDVMTLPEHLCTKVRSCLDSSTLRCSADETSGNEERCNLDKAIENGDICIEQTVDSCGLRCYADQTSEKDKEGNSERTMVSERALTEEVEKVETSNIAETQRPSNNKKKQKQRARKARTKAQRAGDVLTLPEHLYTKVRSCLDSSTLRCSADQTSGNEEGCNSDKAIENGDICIEQTVDSCGLTCYADQTSEKDEECNSERTTVSEQGSSNKELNETGDGDSAEGALTEEVEKVETSNIAETQRPSNNKKKQKQRARKARAKAQRAGDVLTLPKHLHARVVSSLESPQVSFALAFLAFIAILLNMWSLSETL